MKHPTLASAMFGAAISLLPHLASAQQKPKTDTALYRNVGNWQVRVDETMGYGCFVMVSYHSGAILRIGFDNRQATPTAYMLLGNPSWASIEVGKVYSVSFSFDGTAAFVWQGTAIDMHGSTMLDFVFSTPAFLTAVATRQSMNIAYQGRFVTRLNLPGSGVAMATLAECQRQFGTGTTPPADPFQGSGGIPDPFHP